jgi:hypothetical protein
VSPTRVRLVVPRPDHDASTTVLLDLARAVAARPELDLDVLAWLSGPRVDAFAEVAPTVDAGEVDAWAPARALQKVRQHRVAQVVKTPRLKSLLHDLPPAEVTWLGGLPAIAVLGWIDAPDTLVVQVGADDRAGPWADDDRTKAALRSAAVVVATDVDAAAWAETHGVGPERLARHLGLPGPGPVEPPDAGTVGLLGLAAERVPELVTAVALASPAAVGFRWLVDDRAGWDLWQGRGGLLTHTVTVVGPDDAVRAVAGLRVLVHPAGVEVPHDLARLAAVLGVEVVALGGGPDVGAAVAEALGRDRSASAGWSFAADDAAADLADRLAGAR